MAENEATTMMISMKRAKIMATVVAGVFFIIHIMMIFIFARCKVWPMVKLNVFSMLFYLLIL